MTTPPPHPQNIDLFVEVLGLDGTLLLIETYGGTKIWIPKGVGNSSAAAREKLEAEFGKKMTRALVETYGGGPITVPLCKEWRTALYEQRGMSHAQIALRLGCHADTVGRRLKRQRDPDNQPSLPF